MNLTIIEATPSVCLPSWNEANNADEPNVIGSATDEQPHSVRVTSSLRGTIKHLHAKLHRFGHFHGIGATIIYCISFYPISSALSTITTPIGALPPVLTLPIAAVVTAKLAMGALHAQISVNEENKHILQRVKSFTWADTRASILPLAIASAISAGIGSIGSTCYNEWFKMNTAMKVSLLAIIFALYAIRCVINIVLVRIQASTLPVNQTPVLEFNPTFGVVDEDDGFRGIGVKDALRSITRADFWHIFRMGVKLWCVYIVYVIILRNFMVSVGYIKH